MISPSQVRFILLGFFAFMVADHIHGAEPDDRTEAVLASWKKRRSEVRTIDFVATGKGCFVKGTLTEDARGLSRVPIVGEFPAKDHIFPARFRFASRLSERKVRKERDEVILTEVKDGPPDFFNHRRWDLFDGVSGYKFVPNEHRDTGDPDQPQLLLASAGSTDVMIESKDYPFLLAIGVVPYRAANLTIDDLASIRTSPPYSVVGTTTKESSGLLVLRTPSLSASGDRYNELWVDPARDYAIVKYLTTTKSKVDESIDLSYRQAAGGWELVAWRHIFLTGEQISTWYDMSVEKVRLNGELPDELFSVAVTPGMVVLDERDATRYVAGDEPGEKIPLSVARAIESRRESTGLWWFISSAIIAAALLCAFIIWRRGKRS